MSEYLVTGGAGFIGGHLAERLVRDGKSVRILDNFSSGREANLCSWGDRAEIIRGDIRDRTAVTRAMNGVRVVFHLAALPSVPKSVADPLTSHDINVNGTLNVLVAARDARVQRLVFSSSSAVYGDSPDLPKREDMTPTPISPYGLHKLVGEQYGQLFTRTYGLQTVSLRYFNVYGPRQDPQSEYAAAIPAFHHQPNQQPPPTRFSPAASSPLQADDERESPSLPVRLDTHVRRPCRSAP